MNKYLIMLYGIVSYALFFLTFLYLIAFLGNFIVPKTIDSGASGPFLSSIIINLVLLFVFAIQHSVMARPAFKQWLTMHIPLSIERSTYVMSTNIVLILIYIFWQPIPELVWDVESTIGRMIMNGIFWSGCLIVLVSTFLINHFDLFGLRQVYISYKGKEYKHLDFRVVGLYKICRHPIMLGFVIVIWSTPSMSIGHLLFSVFLTMYIFIALQFEERDLISFFGDTYKEYQSKVPMLFPFKF